MDVLNDREPELAPSSNGAASPVVNAAQRIARLSDAQAQTAAQRAMLETLLAQVTAAQEKLATESVAARAALAHEQAKGLADTAATAAVNEHEARERYEHIVAQLNEALQREAAAEAATAASTEAYAAASDEAFACEDRLTTARAELAKAESLQKAAIINATTVSERRVAIEAELAAATETLAKRRVVRAEAEAAATEAERDASAFGAAEGQSVDLLDGVDATIERVHHLDTDIALHVDAEAVKRAANRREADALRRRVNN